MQFVLEDKENHKLIKAINVANRKRKVSGKSKRLDVLVDIYTQLCYINNVD